MVQQNIDLLLGETASGKTEYIKTFFYSREIINCDSRQIYKYFDIGTAKPDKYILQKTKHHLIDICEINEQFTVMKFLNIVKSLLNMKKDYVISAGTPFYINILINGISPLPEIDNKTKQYVKELINNIGTKQAYSLLNDIDKKRAEQLNENDIFRITRALEVYYQTGTPISEFFKIYEKIDISFNNIYYIKKDKRELSKRVNTRIEQMIKKGLIDETEYLCKKYGYEIIKNKKIIGYNEVIDYLQGKTDILYMKEKIYKSTMSYIKSQKTFFKKILENIKFNKLHIIQ